MTGHTEQWVIRSLETAREYGRAHTQIALIDESHVSLAADTALKIGWHVVAVWPSGNRTSVLFRLVSP